jgi:hypothetical protein
MDIKDIVRIAGFEIVYNKEGWKFDINLINS